MDKERQELPFWQERLNTLACQYEQFEKEIIQFTKEAGIRCPEGCGACCSAAYEPEVSLPEGEYAARYILEEQQELESRFSMMKKRSCCIFYDESTPFHCMIYPARPVICRGFGFSGYTNKYGEFIYRPCRHMHPSQFKEHYSNGPIISRYQAQVSFGSEFLPISEAIYLGWQKLKYLNGCSGPEDRAS